MSKKILSAIAEKSEQQIEQFNKQNKIKAKNHGIKVGKVTQEENKAIMTAIANGDTESVLELIDSIVAQPKEAYIRMPDLKISDEGSIKFLKVYSYSAEIKDNILLHKLFSKVRE